MSTFKVHTIEDLKKMSELDLIDLYRKTDCELHQADLMVKNGEDKQSHKIGLYKKQMARINTIRNSKKHA